MSQPVSEASLERASQAPARNRYRWYTVALLFLVGVFNFMDRQVLSILIDPIKESLGASDSAMGLLTGFAFVSFFTIASLPIARLADVYSRSRIIAIGLAFWSVMTVLSGFVGSFFQLALARVGVGIGEAASAPAGHSIISDLFPPKERSVALSAIAVSTPIGLMSAFILAGLLNKAVGWRMTLLFLGLPGLVLSLIVLLTLKEPTRGASESDLVDKTNYNLRETLSYLWGSRALRYLTLGTSLNVLGGWALLVWSPSFLLRVHAMPTHVSGAWLGLAAGLSGIAGTLLSGVITQKLAQRDQRWLLFIPAVSNFLGAPFAALFLLMPSAATALPMFFGVTFFGPAMIGPVSTVIQGVAKVRMRAFAPALIALVFNFVGVGLGPLAVGILSDLLAPRYGMTSIRYALLLTALAPIAAGFAFALGASYLSSDLQRATSVPGS